MKVYETKFRDGNYFDLKSYELKEAMDVYLLDWDSGKVELSKTTDKGRVLFREQHRLTVAICIEIRGERRFFFGNHKVYNWLKKELQEYVLKEQPYLLLFNPFG